MAIGLNEAILLATILGGILFGLYTALFACTMYLLVLKSNSRDRFASPIVLVSVAMYTVALVHISLAITRTMIGFITLGSTSDGTNDYFFTTGNALYLAKTAMYILQTIIGDGFVIYRLSSVWHGDKRLIVPAICCLVGSIACGIGSLIADDTVGSGSVFTLKNWIASFFSLTLFTNGVCTCLIALKIWLVQRRTSKFISFSDLSPIIEIIAESGAVYSAALLSLLGTFLSASWAQYIVLDMVVQIIGIVFSIIIVRLRLGLSIRADLSSTPSGLRSTKMSFHRTGNGTGGVAMPMKPVTIRVNQSHVTHDDFGNAMGMSVDMGDERSPQFGDYALKADSGIYSSNSDGVDV